MDLNYTEAERAFRDELRAWLENNIPDGWQSRNSAGESMEENFAYLRAWQKRATRRVHRERIACAVVDARAAEVAALGTSALGTSRNM
jgi:hypothetical protein